MSSSLFEPYQQEATSIESRRHNLTFWKGACLRLKQNRLFTVAAVLLIILLLLSWLIPFLSLRDYSSQSLSLAERAPCWAFPFGTDKLGRDVLVRVFYATRISFIIALSAVFINLIVGVVLGLIAGFYRGRWPEKVVMFLINNLYAMPLEVVAIIFVSCIRSGVASILLTFAVFGWMQMALLVRGEIWKMRQQEFFHAATATGASPLRIMFKHCLPNLIGPVIVTVTIKIPYAIFMEVTLSYLGLGVKPPMPSLGILIAQGAQNHLRTSTWILLFPSLLTFLLMLTCNIIGDALRDALDPKQANSPFLK